MRDPRRENTGCRGDMARPREGTTPSNAIDHDHGYAQSGATTGETRSVIPSLPCPLQPFDTFRVQDRLDAEAPSKDRASRGDAKGQRRGEDRGLEQLKDGVLRGRVAGRPDSQSSTTPVLPPSSLRGLSGPSACSGQALRDMPLAAAAKASAPCQAIASRQTGDS